MGTSRGVSQRLQPLGWERTRSPSIRDDGLKKALAGATTLEEVLRVTRSD